jgi:DNA repair protein RadC
MGRHEKANPYQYAFDFGQKPLDPAGLVYEGRHRFVRTLHEAVVVRTPAAAAQHRLTHIFTPFAAFEQEELWTLLLNTKQRITHEAMIYRGRLNQVTVRLADGFKPAIRYNTACLILAHNHSSSGDPSPSPEDVFLTEQAFTIGQTLQLAVLDHLVIGQDTWISLKEQGLGFPP